MSGLWNLIARHSNGAALGHQSRVVQSFLFASLIGFIATQIVGDDRSTQAETGSKAVAEQRAALEKLNFLIGDWKGVGQPRRGSSRGAWGETGGWAWSFDKKNVALKFTSPDSRLVREVKITSDDETNRYVAVATDGDGDQFRLSGKMQDGELILQEDAAPNQSARRMTFSKRGDLRLIVLHEQTQPGKDVFFRVAEVGSTRKGKRLALPGGGQPQCVVTGGLGTTEVSYKGQTYYVCCSGCKQAFDDDPEGIIREYKERLKKERTADE